jgi:hypothetical protein
MAQMRNTRKPIADTRMMRREPVSGCRCLGTVGRKGIDAMVPTFSI